MLLCYKRAHSRAKVPAYLMTLEKHGVNLHCIAQYLYSKQMTPNNTPENSPPKETPKHTAKQRKNREGNTVYRGGTFRTRNIQQT